MRKIFLKALILLTVILPISVHALVSGDTLNEVPGFGYQAAEPPLVIVQNGGLTLSEAIDQVRSSGNVERIISAETKVSGGREVHVIKVLTRDGRVVTHRIRGRRVG